LFIENEKENRRLTLFKKDRVASMPIKQSFIAKRQSKTGVSTGIAEGKMR